MPNNDVTPIANRIPAKQLEPWPASYPVCFVALAVLFVALPAWSGEEAVRYGYVNASRLPLRATPSVEAQAVAHVVTNQRLHLIASQGEWCEVAESTGDARGYCQCKYLGESPLSMSAIDDRLAHSKLTARERLDWLARAFWVAPSLERWISVGKAMDEVLLSKETRDKEYAEGKPLRFKVPEFEAMKKRLEQGMVAPATKALEPTSSGYDQARDTALKRVTLPNIKPSLFDEGDAFALPGRPFKLESSTAGGQLVDRLSATHGVPFRVRVEQPVFYLGGNAETMVAAWDVGAITASFDAPVRINGVTRRGLPTALDIQAVGMDFNLGGCYGSTLALNTRAVKKMPPWQDTLVAWVGKPATGNATVKTRRDRGKGPYDALVVDDIDLDGDGVADFSIWNGRYRPTVSAEGLWQAVYANIAGKWQLLAYQEDLDCT